MSDFRRDLCDLIESYGIRANDVINIDGRDLFVVVYDQDGQPMLNQDKRSLRTRPIPLRELKKRDRDGRLS